MQSKKWTVLAVAALAAGGLMMLSPVSTVSAQNQPPQTVNTVTGITKPYVSSKLSLSEPGIVLELPVKEGDTIKKGDLLLQQDDRKPRAELESVQLEAKSDAEIRATDADRQVKEVQLKRVQELSAKGSATPSELEEAQVKVIYAVAQVDLAKLKQQMKQLEAKAGQVRLDQMRLTSPVDGKIEAIDVSVGEITDPKTPCMTIAQLNPLYIEFYLPVQQAQMLKMDQTLEIKYENQQKWLPAKVKFRAPVAEASAGMQKLRLELDNPNNADAGFQVQVKLPPELAPAGGAPGTALLPAP